MTGMENRRRRQTSLCRRYDNGGQNAQRIWDRARLYKSSTGTFLGPIHRRLPQNEAVRPSFLQI